MFTDIDIPARDIPRVTQSLLYPELMLERKLGPGLVIIDYSFVIIRPQSDHLDTSMDIL